MTLSPAFLMSYLWDFVGAQQAGDMGGDLRIASFENSHQVTSSSAAVVWDIVPSTSQEVHQGVGSDSSIKMSLIDVVTQGEVGQDLRIPVDVLNGK